MKRKDDSERRHSKSSYNQNRMKQIKSASQATDIEELRRFSTDSYRSVRFAVFTNTNADQEIINTLSKEFMCDTNPFIRQLVARLTNDKEILSQLVNDSDNLVSREALRHMNVLDINKGSM